jgi:hypothetical protein
MTHVEAHMGDRNSGEKSGADAKRCVFEARVARLKFIGITPVVRPWQVDVLAAGLTHLLHLVDLPESLRGPLRDGKARCGGQWKSSAKWPATKSEAGTTTTAAISCTHLVRSPPLPTDPAPHSAYIAVRPPAKSTS